MAQAGHPAQGSFPPQRPPHRPPFPPPHLAGPHHMGPGDCRHPCSGCSLPRHSCKQVPCHFALAVWSSCCCMPAFCHDVRPPLPPAALSPPLSIGQAHCCAAHSAQLAAFAPSRGWLRAHGEHSAPQGPCRWGGPGRCARQARWVGSWRWGAPARRRGGGPLLRGCPASSRVRAHPFQLQSRRLSAAAHSPKPRPHCHAKPTAMRPRPDRRSPLA